MITERTEIVGTNPEILGSLQFNTHKINKTTKVFELHVEILNDLSNQIKVQTAQFKGEHKICLYRKSQKHRSPVIRCYFSPYYHFGTPNPQMLKCLAV